MRSDTARRIRATAKKIDSSHPETNAGDHLRAAAQQLEWGNHDGAKRHLDAAMELMTPRNLIRHGVVDDEGHATGKQAMHHTNLHRLAVMDIEDLHHRNGQAAEHARLTRVSNETSTAQSASLPADAAGRGGPSVGPSVMNAPPGTPVGVPDRAAAGPASPDRRGSKQISGSGVGTRNLSSFLTAIELVGPKGYSHGWVYHGLPQQWAPVVVNQDKQLVHRLPNGTEVPLHDPRALMPYRSPIRSRRARQLVTEMSAETGRLAVTPAPRGRPGGPGLYDVKGMGHTPYLQQIVKALIEKRGMPESRAYAIARGAIRRWMRGGGHVHPEVRAAAGAAEAGELERQGRAKAMHGHASWYITDILIELAQSGQQGGGGGQRPQSSNWKNEQRVAKGSPGGGQFSKGGGQGQAKQGPHHTAGQHLTGAKAAKYHRLQARARSLRSQISALMAQYSSATSGRSAKSASSTPRQTGAGAQSAAAAKSSASAAKTGSSSSSPSTSSKGATASKSAATIHGQIIALRAQLAAVLAQMRAL